MPEAAQQTETIAPAARPNPLVQLREQLNSRLGEFKHALPPQIPPERFLRVALTAVQMNPELAVVERRSLFNALMKCASDGLVPDGRQAAIVPFKDHDRGQVATYMPMVAGLLARFRNSGQFKALTANVVREGEQFRHWIDEQGEHLLHEPGENDAAPIIKAYAMATTRDGGVAIRVMSKAAIDKRRAVSRGKDGPMWREWYDEAAQKTVLRNLMKLLPSSSDDIDRMIARDEALEFDTASITHEPAAETRERIGLASALDQFGGGATAAATAEMDNKELALTSDSAGNPSTQSPPVDHEHESGEADKPTLDPLLIARKLGAEHRRAGVQRRAVPPDYRDKEREAELIAWRDGWDRAMDNEEQNNA